MGNPVLVPTNAATLTRLSDSATTDNENIDFTTKERGSSCTTSKTKTTGNSFIREAISNRELPQEMTPTRGEHQQDQDGNVIHYCGIRISILLVQKAYSNFYLVCIIMVF